MTVPVFVDRNPQAIADYVMREYAIAADAWELLAVKMGKAYDIAYKAQETVLQAVKARKLENAKADQFAFNFVLSLLTVGVAGATGGALARSIFEDRQKTAIDAAKAVGQSNVQQIVAQFRDVLDP